jgi:hypothetical protein
MPHEERRPLGAPPADFPPAGPTLPPGTDSLPLHRRREASQRLQRLGCCECRDPLGCRHHRPPLTNRQLDGYRAAVVHLTGAGLLAAPDIDGLRRMWRSGRADRRLAARVAAAWELAS